MIKLPKLEESDLIELKENKVVLYITKGAPTHLYEILRILKIDVLGCCVKNLDVESYVKLKVCGIKIIKFKDLTTLKEKNKNLIVHCGGFEPGESEKLKNDCKKLKFKYTNITTGQISSSFSHLIYLKIFNNPTRYWLHKLNWKRMCIEKTTLEFKQFMNKDLMNPIIICSPPKTADITLNHTFDEINNEKDFRIDYVNLSHKSRIIQKKWCESKLGTLKIITGIREPISQNISRFYQDVSTGMDVSNWIFGELENCSTVKKKKLCLCEMEYLFTNNMEDLQVLWEAYIERFIYSDDSNKKLSVEPKTVQNFLEEFSENILDLTQYPFDKEKGYSIIKEGNTEVFVYQLEKLDLVIAELSEWIGVPFYKLKNGNLASDKWIGNSYKQAQKEITFTKEYFDRCYDEIYVKHFYSEKDIEKFKDKWRLHIIDA